MKSKLQKLTVNFPDQLMADIHLLSDLSGSSQSEIIREGTRKLVKDQIEHHLLKRDVLQKIRMKGGVQA